ncbi:hypothetical protein CEXT_749511 [Caerostris extrusa]|uniref:Uncharacterized protein n=1 Tax=Caerostris extrusa TaxID=172846 RepID=A0AAV4XVI5_CAEEX|nr:hypothetical protein CEXT_749511 [Caerostris extrusa]
MVMIFLTNSSLNWRLDHPYTKGSRTDAVLQKSAGIIDTKGVSKYCWLKIPKSVTMAYGVQLTVHNDIRVKEIFGQLDLQLLLILNISIRHCHALRMVSEDLLVLVDAVDDSVVTTADDYEWNAPRCDKRKI